MRLRLTVATVRLVGQQPVALAVLPELVGVAEEPLQAAEQAALAEQGRLEQARRPATTASR